MTAEYLEKKPVPFRKKLVNDLLKELSKDDDGSAGVKRHKGNENGVPSK